MIRAELDNSTAVGSKVWGARGQHPWLVHCSVAVAWEPGRVIRLQVGIPGSPPRARAGKTLSLQTAAWL